MNRKEVVISNSKLNSHGFRVLTEGIDAAQYRRNPVLLWMHQRPYGENTLPVGRMENLRVEGDSLIGTPVFDEKDDFAKKIKSKWEQGFIVMASAGLDVIETSQDAAHLVPGQTRATVSKSKLVEVSLVDIGANDDALALYAGGRTVNLSAGGELSLCVPEMEIKTDLNINKMKVIALKLGLPEVATEAKILEKIGGLQTSAGNAAALQAEVDRQRESAILSEVERAIKLKRITADKKDHFVSLGKTSGIESLRLTLEMIPEGVKPTDVIKPGAGGTSTGTDYKKLSDVPEAERIAMRNDDIETYKALYLAEYGVKCDI